MAKKKNTLVYKCNSCGNTQPRWLGRCIECFQWNTYEEFLLSDEAKKNISNNQDWLVQKPVKLSTVDAMAGDRLFTGISEFDRVLGGGAMKRSAILIGGEPGI
ncbi:MAG: hypothetical protein J6Q47_03260 [Paludibacteraceae bacterium]|nr:hypothetical protein [Paludibacteraceae bacterium]